MSTPIRNRFLHTAFILIEVGLVWMAVAILMGSDGLLSTELATLLLLFGAIALTAHLVALLLRYVLPKAPADKHRPTLLLCVVGPMVLVPLFLAGLAQGWYHASGQAAIDAHEAQVLKGQIRQTICATATDVDDCVEREYRNID